MPLAALSMAGGLALPAYAVNLSSASDAFSRHYRAESLLDSYESARADYEATLAQYLEVLAEYEDAAGAALAAKEALDQVSEEEACEDSSAYEAALRAYSEAEASFAVTDAKFQELEGKFKTAQALFAEASLPLQTYYDALEAQESAQSAADTFNALVDEINDLLSHFPAVEAGADLLGGDYATQLAQWMDDFGALMPKLPPALNDLVTAAEAFEAANEAYNASGVAPAGNPVGAVVLPEGFAAAVNASLAEISQDVDDAIKEIQAYLTMLEAARTFNERYAEYSDTVEEAEDSLIDDLNPQFLCLKYGVTQNLALVGLPGYNLDQVATVENLQPIVDGYKQYTPLAIESAILKVQDAVDRSKSYLAWQEEYQDALEQFNQATGQSYYFYFDDLMTSLPNIEQTILNVEEAYQYNVSNLESSFSLINGNRSLSDLLRGGNWKTSGDTFAPAPNYAPTITVPAIDLDVADLDGVSVLEIVAPDLPVTLSELPDPVDPLALEALANPCQPGEPGEPGEPGSTSGTGQPGGTTGLAATGASIAGAASIAALAGLGGIALAKSRRQKDQ